MTPLSQTGSRFRSYGASKLGIFGLDFGLPEVNLPPLAPPVLTPPPPGPAEPTVVEVPEEFAFVTTGTFVACPNADGTFTLREAGTMAVMNPRAVAPFPPGTTVLPVADPRCGGAPAPESGVGTDTVLIGAGVALGVVALVAILS